MKLIKLMLRSLILVVLCLVFAKSFADSSANTIAQEIDVAQLMAVKKALANVIPREPDHIGRSPISGLLEVTYGVEVVYVSEDGRHFISGDIVEFESKENLTELAKRSGRAKVLEAKDYQPVVFGADNEQHVVTIFTDIDCPYCAKLHREIPDFNALGISVKYLMFPRAGLGTPSFDKAVSMWCSDDNQQAMTDAKERKPIPNLNCENPIAEQYRLGQSLGVRGTPALITEEGTMIPGYVSAKDLSKILEGS